MKKALVIALLIPLAGCSFDSEFSNAHWEPLFGSSSGSAPAAAPAPAAGPPLAETAIALSELQAKRYPPAGEEDFKQIDGVRESHPGRNAAECEKLQLWFANQGIYLKLKIKSNPMPGNRKQVLCVFEGPNAIAQRFGLYNDMHEKAGIPYPENNAGYPPNPYDGASDPLNNPPSGRPRYQADPNHYDDLRQSPQPSPGAIDGEAPFTQADLDRLEANRRRMQGQ